MSAPVLKIRACIGRTQGLSTALRGAMASSSCTFMAGATVPAIRAKGWRPSAAQRFAAVASHSTGDKGSGRGGQSPKAVSYSSEGLSINGNGNGNGELEAVEVGKDPQSLAPRVVGTKISLDQEAAASEPRSFSETIGNTKLVELTTLTPRPDVKIMLKCEFQNPGLSIKDRIAEHILDEAERTGQLKPGSTVVAASSGNTAAAFAMLCSVRGYGCVAITNTKCSDEKVNALKAYGATIIVTRGGVPPDHPEHYQMIENRLVAENPTWFGVNQYDNPKNPEAYYRTIAPEIWEQTHGEVTHFVAAASTGGTISGIGRYLKEQSDGKVKVICPDPVGSIFHDFWASGGVPPTDSGESFSVEGVGKDSIPDNFDISLIDAMPQVACRDAFLMCRKLSEQEGLLCGGSTGVNVHAAVEMAKDMELAEGETATIVCIAPDSGVKYLSKIYSDEWLLEEGLIDEAAAPKVEVEGFEPCK